ncbi:MAG TPA: C40 family peptidase [Chitinophagaceae bacterium]|nr:C40 family peptidase [Chitinophagaceae bacterium]
MKNAMVAVAAAPVRKKASHTAEMVNQLLYGEVVQILKSKDAIWVKVRSIHDAYEGWLQKLMLTEQMQVDSTDQDIYAVADLFTSLKNEGQVVQIPAGSLIYSNAGSVKLKHVMKVKGKLINISKQNPSVALLRKLTSSWVNVPYLWGGRTPMGIDCSGLVQIIYRLMGIALPRDAWQQAQAGRPIRNVSEIRAGDLAFFERNKKITHVGIILPGKKMIHASGKVKVDKVEGSNIIDAITGEKILRIKKIVRLF